MADVDGALTRLIRWVVNRLSRVFGVKGGRAIGTVTETHHVYTLVDARTGETHLVTDDAVDVGRRAGRYLAVCDVEVLAASLTVPDGKRCRYCVQRAVR